MQSLLLDSVIIDHSSVLAKSVCTQTPCCLNVNHKNLRLDKLQSVKQLSKPYFDFLAHLILLGM